MTNSATARLLARLVPADEDAATRFMFGMCQDKRSINFQWRMPSVFENSAQVARHMRDWAAGMARQCAWDARRFDETADISAEALAPLVKAKIERLVSGADRSRPFGQGIAASCEPAHQWWNEIGIWMSTNPPSLDGVDWLALTEQLLAMPSRKPMIAPRITSSRAA